MKRLLPILALLLVLAVPAAAQDKVLGLVFYKQGNYAAALDEFRPLAEQGDALAQHYLGVMYHNGQGVPQDYQEAVKWTKKAAEQDFAQAQAHLGSMYTSGHGVPESYVLATKWYRKAAERGYVEAQAMVGVFYLEGRGVPQNYVLAHKWLNLAAAQGDQVATKIREHVAERMTPEQIAEAQKLAREWMNERGQ